ncbi:MAG TPA: hypothetical protein VIU82_03330 [Bosea sp. (in: a-proteobacteria)]
MAILRYTKAGTGQRNGARWVDARALATLAQDLRLARPDDRFLIGFDRDREDPVFWSEASLEMSRAGATGRPIRLAAGYIGHSDDVEPIDPHSLAICFVNSQLTSLRRAAPSMIGKPYIVVNQDAGFVDIAGLSLRGAPDQGFIRFDAVSATPTTYSQISVHNLHAARIGRLIETQRGARLADCVIEDCSAFSVSRGFARFRSLERSTLRRLVIDGGGLDGGGENVCQMLAFETGTKVTLDTVYMHNAVNMLAAGEGKRSSYVQGDGVVCERETADFTFRNCHVSAMGDGGFDLKTRGFVMENCSAVACKFGIRIWSEGPNLIRRSAVHSPRPAGPNRGACVWFAGKADLIDCDLQAGGNATVFQSGDGGAGQPVLRLYGGSIRNEGPLPLLIGNGGGRVELHDVAINGETRTGVLTL